MLIAGNIQSVRVNHTQSLFHGIGDILSVPAISDQSPFLLNNSTSINVPSDTAYEAIPAQLLPRLRADALGTMALANNQPVVNFTDWSGHTYVIQVSTDLVNWVNISTNYLLNEHFNYTNSPNTAQGPQFYRTRLQP